MTETPTTNPYSELSFWRFGLLATGKWLFSALHAARVREKAAIFFDLKRLYADSLGWQERNPQGWVALFNMATLATDSAVVKKSIWRSVR